MTARLPLRAVLAAGLGMALAGCGLVPGDPVTAATPTSALPPQRALMAAIPDAKTGAFRFTVTGGDTRMTGVLDSAKATAEFDVVHGTSLAETIRVFDRQAWVRFTVDKDLAGPPPRKWLTVAFQDSAPFSYALENDPGFAGVVVGFGTNIRETSPGRYDGVTDLTSAYPNQLLDGDRIDALGEKVRSLPFTAVLNATGHLASLTLQIPAAPRFPATTYQVDYDGFGTTVDPAKPPAADQTPAPDWLYRTLGATMYPGPAV